MLERLQALKDGEGLTLRHYTSIVYKSGWQVADTGIECTTAAEAAAAIESMHGSCGVWYEAGIYYIDHSFRVSTKKEALAIGRAHNQISILKWSNMSLVYC